MTKIIFNQDTNNEITLEEFQEGFRNKKFFVVNKSDKRMVIRFITEEDKLHVSKKLEQLKNNAIKQKRIKELKQIMQSIHEDKTQVDFGAVITDWEERKRNFNAAHSELRILEGKEPRGFNPVSNYDNCDGNYDNYQGNYQQSTYSHKNNGQTVQMQIEALQNELNSINAMIKSFTQNRYSEEELAQLQQAQLDIIKQLQQLK